MPDFTSFKMMKLCKQIMEKVTALPDAITAVKNLVATNNTANKAGILSQKVSYLIQLNEAHGSLERATAGSQNWTCPAGVYQVLVIAAGGSGGGGGGGGGAGGVSKESTFLNPAQGGASGGHSAVGVALLPVIPGTTYTISVGNGGSAGAAGISLVYTSGPQYTSPMEGGKGGNGGNGGATKFGDLFTVNGGGGGAGGAGAKTNQKEASNVTAAAAGVAGKISDNQKIIFKVRTAGISGKASAATTSQAGGYSGTNVNGMAGASNNIGAFGEYSGAGGTGGWCGYQKATNGSAGAAGSPGYIKIMW